MLKKGKNRDIIDLKVRWDIMNNNLLISTAMLSAYWEKEKKDILAFKYRRILLRRKKQFLS